MNARAVAANCLYQVIYQGRSLTDVLQYPQLQKLDAQDQSFVKDLCFGCLRWHYQLDYILGKLLTKPLKDKDKDVECLLRIGLYQLQYQQTAEYAAVNETVRASKKLKKSWSKGLINGVLRSFIRRREKLSQKLADHPAYPKWLIREIEKAWPSQSKEILQASNMRAPMTLRVNLSQISRDEYINQLNAAGIRAQLHPSVETAINLAKPVNVNNLPGFDAGMVSVQDAAAQLAAPLLDCKAGMHVLDACAAPGGKTGHLAEFTANLQITAIDNVAERLSMLQHNMDRLGFRAKLIQADANCLPDWYDGRAFDAILLDAPCSALGVIRRHPDIKMLRKQTDLDSLVLQQQKLLETLWSILKPGGKLLYATCSILPQENEQQIQKFVENHAEEVNVLQIMAEWGLATESGRQILPGKENMDGFYYSLLQKAAKHLQS